MINIVKGNADAAPNLPPQDKWINLPVGYNVSEADSGFSNILDTSPQVSDNPSINVSSSQEVLLFFSPGDLVV